MASIFLAIAIISIVFIASFLFNIAVDNIKEDIIEEVLNRLEVEDND